MFGKLLRVRGTPDNAGGLTPGEFEREPSIERTIELMGLSPADYLILDDDVAAFSALSGRLVACNPLTGISDLLTRSKVRQWAAGG